MKWTVEGADRRSGAEVSLTIDAASEADATRRAAAGGIVVVRATRVGTTPGSSPPSEGPTVERSPQQRVPCPSCAELIYPAATLCPFCKQPVFSRRPGTNALVGLLVMVIVSVFAYFAIWTFIHYESKNEIKRVLEDSQEMTDRLMRDAERDADEMMRRLSR